MQGIQRSGDEGALSSIQDIVYLCLNPTVEGFLLECRFLSGWCTHSSGLPMCVFTGEDYQVGQQWYPSTREGHSLFGRCSHEMSGHQPLHHYDCWFCLIPFHRVSVADLLIDDDPGACHGSFNSAKITTWVHSQIGFLIVAVSPYRLL